MSQTSAVSGSSLFRLVLPLSLAAASLAGSPAAGATAVLRQSVSRASVSPAAVAPQDATTGIILQSPNYSISGGNVELTVDSISNSRSSGTSGSLFLELWASVDQPVFGNPVTYYQLASYNLGTLAVGHSFTSVDVVALFSPPPAGTYWMSVAVTEYNGGSPPYPYDDFVTLNQQSFGTAGCVPDSQTLCLNNGRFEVVVQWTDFQGNTGFGNVVPGVASPDSGLMWFFGADNWEMLVKVLNGCPVNNHYWVFAALTTNVQYTIRVTDTLTGQFQTYFNPLGNPAPAITDAAAFATCP